jgi:MFS family permease
MGKAAAVPANVVALGLVSLVTDVSSEMITAILPIYLSFGLGLSPLGLGFVDGLYGGISALVRLAGGYLADRFQSRKAMAGLGYGLSALSKLGLLAAGSSVPGIAASIGVDRTGKGLRTAPRDALISLSAPAEALGRAFGVHRAMDTAGAVAGPLVAFAILWTIPGRYDVVFVLSFCIAVAALIVLWAFVRDHREPLPSQDSVSLGAALGLLREPGFRNPCWQASLLGLFSVSDAFVYLLLQRRLEVGIAYFPLFPVATASAYLLLSVPMGRLADRIVRWRVFLAGNLALAGIYSLLLAPLNGFILPVAVLGLHGFFYAATNGVLMAKAAPSLPEDLRSSGLALLQTGTALASLLSSVLFGGVWSAWGPNLALKAFLAGLLLALIPVLAVTVRSRRSRT